MEVQVTPDSVLAVPEAVVWQELDGKVVALHTGLGKYISLNASASLLWSAVDGRRTIAQLACILSETYGVDGPTALQDALELFGQLVERGFLEAAI